MSREVVKSSRDFIGAAAVALRYSQVIQTPLLARWRPAMRQMADRFEGAVSVGLTMGLDLLYEETCAHERGTLKRPGVGTVRGNRHGPRNLLFNCTVPS